MKRKLIRKYRHKDDEVFIKCKYCYLSDVMFNNQGNVYQDRLCHIKNREIDEVYCSCCNTYSIDRKAMTDWHKHLKLCKKMNSHWKSIMKFKKFKIDIEELINAMKGE